MLIIGIDPGIKGAICILKDGVIIDKVVLQQSGSTPTGFGPSGSMSTNGFNSGLMAEFFDNAGLAVNTSGMPDLNGRIPDFTRIDPMINYSNSNNQFLYVNGRIINDKSLNTIIKVAYRDVLFHDRFPQVIINIKQLL